MILLLSRFDMQAGQPGKKKRARPAWGSALLVMLMYSCKTEAGVAILSD